MGREVGRGEQKEGGRKRELGGSRKECRMEEGGGEMEPSK